MSRVGSKLSEAAELVVLRTLRIGGTQQPSYRLLLHRVRHG